MKLARTIRFDESDGRVLPRAAEPGEWAVPGGFEFSNWTPDDLDGKPRQAFATGWLGLQSFGRSTLVAVTPIEPAELAHLAGALARHFRQVYGAPSEEAARAAAEDELAFMRELCESHDPNTLITVKRELTAVGVRESFRAIVPSETNSYLVSFRPMT